MSFLDLYQGDQEQAARMQPNEGTRLPSGFDENLHAAWSDGLLFSQSVARDNARAAVLGDYIDEVRQKTGNDLSQELTPDISGNQIGVTNFDQANARVAKMKADYPDLDLAPLTEDEIDARAVAKSQAAHRNYQALQAGERTTGGTFGSFLGSAGASAADPVNLLALAAAPETGGASILSAALRWGALAGVSQGAIEFASDSFKEQVQPGYTESGEPIKEIGGAFLGGAVLGGGLKALGNAWTRVKTGQWPTSVRDAGNVIESEANVASTNIFPGVEGEVAHREAVVKTIDDILGGRPVDVSRQITPELTDAATEAERAKAASGETIWYQGVHSQAGEKPISDYWTTDLEKAKEYSGPNGQVFAARESSFPSEALDTKTGNVLSNKTITPGQPYSIPEVETLGKLPRSASAEDFAALNRKPAQQLDLPLAPETEPVAPKRASEPGPQPQLQTAEQASEALTAPDHQDAIRADIDRERATGDFKVPGVDENGNHTMVSVDAAMDEVDAYKKLADDIQVCASPIDEGEKAA